VEECDAVITAAPTTLAAVVYGGAPIDHLGISGDRSVAEKFVTLFVLPPKVGEGS
jgi:hypothetical protein